MTAAPTLLSSGTQAATIGTEHTLLDIATACVVQLYVDKENMVAGDVLELRCYQIMLTGDTRQIVYGDSFNGVPAAFDVFAISPIMSNDLTDAGSIRFTLKQTVGTGRNFKWKVLQF